MISTDLTGKRVLVTGGTSGIGLGCVTLFARLGASVIANHLPDDVMAISVINKLISSGLDVRGAPGSVASAEDTNKFVRESIDKLHGLDYLVNNAATPGTRQPIPPENLEEMTEEFWHLLLNTNLVGTFRCAKVAAPALKESGGAIVNLASIAGLGTQGSSIAYAASKAGVVNLTRSLARALAPSVRVNAVAPGQTATPWTEAWSDERKKTAIEKSFLKRRSTPEDIAEVVVFLCSSAAMMTGQTLVVDGGMTL